jgi:hypothetical protein
LPDALEQLRRGRPVRQARQLAEDQVGHRGALARGPLFERAMQLIRDVAHLDHLHVQNRQHVSHMIDRLANLDAIASTVQSRTEQGWRALDVRF